MKMQKKTYRKDMKTEKENIQKTYGNAKKKHSENICENGKKKTFGKHMEKKTYRKHMEMQKKTYIKHMKTQKKTFRKHTKT